MQGRLADAASKAQAIDDKTSVHPVWRYTRESARLGTLVPSSVPHRQGNFRFVVEDEPLPVRDLQVDQFAISFNDTATVSTSGT